MKLRLVAFVGLLILLALAIRLGWLDGLSLEGLRLHQAGLLELKSERPLLVTAAFFGVYVVVTALSIPGALVLTLAAGALFGLLTGVLLVSFASTLGATAAFLLSRHLLREAVVSRYAAALERINRGLSRDGWRYLFALRLVPVVPFFLINLVFGLTRMPVRTFFLVSQVGMLAGTIVYVNAGTQLARINSPADILSPSLWGAFALLAVFPWLAGGFTRWLELRQRYRGFRRPLRFDSNLVVIGAGAAGLVTSYIGAAVRAKVTLVESHRMGGDCLNTGCVPSKALIHASRQVRMLQEASRFGVIPQGHQVDFQRVMHHVHESIRTIAPNDSMERYEGLGVEVLEGQASFIDPWTVEIRQPDGTALRRTAPQVVLATGAAPVIPDIPGLRDVDFRTSETLWQIDRLPQRLVVLGGGPIGCELAQAFATLGSKVVLVERGSRLLSREDAEAAAALREALEASGVRVCTHAHVLRVEPIEAGGRVLIQDADGRHELPFDQILVATGRRPRLQGLGLERLGIGLEPGLELDESLRTRLPHILACGDVAGHAQFTHAAAHAAWHAAVNALFAPWLWLRGGPFRVDWRFLPRVTFTHPAVAAVGLGEAHAREQGIDFELTRYELAELDRGITEGETHGFIKVLTVPGKDRILGVSIVSDHADELLGEWVLAMRHGLGLSAILSTIHAYPTWGEANKYVAGRWKQAHAPVRLLAWLERWHRWRRGGPR
jgi:pyruvate/2-oxoglutarate dehydrogenase complex dihydrolipoamide dehydrogenase (E3) component/uncharacterized membrane protein YdjX (TVP38/TMEM64 family)